LGGWRHARSARHGWNRALPHRHGTLHDIDAFVRTDAALKDFTSGWVVPSPLFDEVVPRFSLRQSTQEIALV
jgi:hypothetical protein